MAYIYLSFLETLQEILSKIFNDILAPIVSSVLDWALKEVTDYLIKALADLFLDGFIMLLKAVNLLNQMFMQFAGTANIKYAAAGTSTPEKSGTLISYIFQLSSISKVLLAISLVGGILAFLFAIYSTAKSIGDLTTEEERAQPISAVLKNGFKSMVSFLLIPVLCVVLLQASSALLTSVSLTFQYATGNEKGGTGIDDILFITAAANAVTAVQTTSMTDAAGPVTTTMTADEIRALYSANHAYTERDKVKEAFDISEIDYLLGYISTLLVILILGGSVISFIRRIFDLLILYIVSPFFSATIALDGGSKFRGWKDMFVGKFFSCFGAVFAMDLFLLVSPVIANSETLKFSGDPATDRVIKLFFVIGAAWSVFKGQSIFMQILNPEAADNESGSLLMSGLAMAGGLAGRMGSAGIAKASQKFNGQKTAKAGPEAGGKNG